VWAAISTAVVALAAIAATFFAPARVARKIERRREAREFQRSARLVGHEVRKNAVSAGVIRGFVEKAEDVLPEIERFFWTEHWDREAAVLAASLSDEDWRDVQYAYGLLIGAVFSYTAVRWTLERGDDLSNSDRDDCAGIMNRTHKGFDEADTILARAEPLTD
jgi:HAMP domain-containing protein